MPRSAQTLFAFVLACALGPLPAVAQDVAGTLADGYARTLSLMAQPSVAAMQVSVVVNPGRHSNAGLAAELRAARTAMLEGGDIGPDLLRRLAERGDGLAAQKYVRLLVVDPAATASDIAYFAALAVTTGRVWTLPEAVAAMRELDPATEPPDRVRAYFTMLYPHAWAGNALALDAVIDLNGPGRLFGPLSEATRARILQADALVGDGRAVLRLALNLLGQADLTAQETALAHSYLVQAAASNHLGVQVTASHILQQLDAAAVLSQ